MHDVISSSVLDGGNRRMAFTCPLPLLSAIKYHMAGQLVQWSIQHGGPGIPVLSSQLYQLLVGDDAVTFVDVAVPNANVTALLYAVSMSALYSASWLR